MNEERKGTTIAAIFDKMSRYFFVMTVILILVIANARGEEDVVWVFQYILGIYTAVVVPIYLFKNPYKRTYPRWECLLDLSYCYEDGTDMWGYVEGYLADMEHLAEIQKHHSDVVMTWKEECQNDVDRSLISWIRRMQYNKACKLLDSSEFVFRAVKRVSTYEQVDSDMKRAYGHNFNEVGKMQFTYEMLLRWVESVKSSYGSLEKFREMRKLKSCESEVDAWTPEYETNKYAAIVTFLAIFLFILCLVIPWSRVLRIRDKEEG